MNFTGRKRLQCRAKRVFVDGQLRQTATPGFFEDGRTSSTFQRKQTRHPDLRTGIHLCLGAKLAREEGRYCVSKKLFERFLTSHWDSEKSSRNGWTQMCARPRGGLPVKLTTGQTQTDARALRFTAERARRQAQSCFRADNRQERGKR